MVQLLTNTAGSELSFLVGQISSDNDQVSNIRSVIVCTLVAVCGVLSAFTTSFVFLLLARLAVGIGVGGLVVPFDLLTELLPASARGSFLIYIRLFWTLGSIYVAGSSAILLDLTSWRIITCLAAAPVALAGILAAVFVPESPHWLLAHNRARDAEDTLRYAFAAVWPITRFIGDD